MINQSEKDTGPAVQGAAAESQFAPFGFAASRGSFVVLHPACVRNHTGKATGPGSLRLGAKYNGYVKVPPSV